VRRIGDRFPPFLLLVPLVSGLSAWTMSAAADEGPDPGPDMQIGSDPAKEAADGHGEPDEALDDPGPLFWVWQEPLGDAAHHPAVIRLVRTKTNRQPAVAADEVCDRILARGLGPGQVAILLQSFGMGDGNPLDLRHNYPALFNHWCDGLPHEPVELEELDCSVLAEVDADPKWWKTLWMSRGIEECTAWIQQFIARYQVRQAGNPDIPDPYRFHFDSESNMVPHCGGAVSIFHEMRSDPRWHLEPIPGHDGKTLAVLYAEGGEPGYDPTRPWNHLPNRGWSSWYHGICRQAAEGAMEQSAYRLIRQAWSECRNSSFGRSDRYDGQGDPPRYKRLDQYPWYLAVNTAFADLQAPIFWWAEPGYAKPGETQEAATVRRASEILQANRHSFDGPHHDIVPWLELIGNQRSDDGVYFPPVTESLMHDLLAMLKAENVREFIVWSYPTTQHGENDWNDFVDIIQELWDIDSFRTVPHDECDEVVGVQHLVDVILAWGPCPEPPPCPADMNGDGIVDSLDLLQVILRWGECP
jgi:hypothetical protein